MGLFDQFKSGMGSMANAAGNIASGVAGAVKQSNAKRVDVTFPQLPQTLGELQALPQAAMSTPFDTAALTVAALAAYPVNREEALAMLAFLKGPAGFSEREKQFIRDRFMDKDYVPRSYFKGATPQNDYTPQTPVTVTVSENPYSYDDAGYAKLYLQSAGADSPRAVQLRKAKDGKWYLWEQFLLADIRQPESADPWA